MDGDFESNKVRIRQYSNKVNGVTPLVTNCWFIFTPLSEDEIEEILLSKGGGEGRCLPNQGLPTT